MFFKASVVYYLECVTLASERSRIKSPVCHRSLLGDFGPGQLLWISTGEKREGGNNTDTRTILLVCQICTASIAFVPDFV